ncbi:hypothetical protein SAMN05421812_101187 [Asanoa hainanensis]|uniref:Uncharacterized protein n=1 Tax=Asanoa hainanensis TaxID=560556 RepID=A0A239G212_9ACTN|nr:hypothetical protein [Asanoa hainanensis]SNS63090.1 hypothetical protein SAMN05421812_101187 [Asanoa hainanensis]
MAQRLRLRSPSGNRVTVDLADTPTVANVSASIRYAGGSLARGFQIGSRGFQKFASTYVAASVVHDRFVVHGREVVVARQIDGAGATAALIGDYHELMTVYGGPPPAREAVISLFSTLTIEDRADGMVVKPLDATLLNEFSELLTIAVAGRGLVSVPGPAHMRHHVPAHQGQATRHGEVWRGLVGGVDKASRISDYLFTMGFSRGVSEVHLTPEPDLSDDALLAWMNEIQVDWAADTAGGK